MKIASNTVEVQSNIVFDETYKIGIADDDEAVKMVIERLISAYDNPYRAALREYTSNAYDEHIQSGQTRPVEVSLPDAMSPVLKVQDFGRGLTREELKGFGTIGKSTKRDSNDTTGGFGMGSKCALAAAPQFTVSSVKNGKRNTVIVARDENNVPHMNFLAEMDTADESGTTITIPISDRDKFGDLTQFWIGWPDGSILIDDEPPVQSVYDEKRYRELLDGKAYYNLHNATAGRDAIRFLINQVYYEIDYRKAGLDYNQWNILKYYVIRLDNGSVDIAPSRETLQFNARTKAAIEARTRMVLSLARTELAKAVDDAPDLRTALQLRDRMEREGYPVLDLRWKGMPLLLPGDVVKGNALPYHEGTWASPRRTHGSTSGWMVEKTYGHIGNKKPWRNDESRNRFVIVYGAAEAGRYATSSSRSRRAHREAFGVADWLSEQDNARDYTWDFFITSEPFERINKAYRNVASVLIPAHEFNEVIRKVRAERAAATRAANAKDKTALKETKLRVLVGSYYGSAETRDMTVIEIKDKYKGIIFLRNQTPGVLGQIRDSLTTKVNHRSQLSDAALEISRTNELALILIGKNDDMTELLPLLPPETTIQEQAVKTILSTEVKANKWERMALRDRDSRDAYSSLSSFRNLNESHTNKIKRKETRLWVKALSEFVDTGAAIRDRYSWMSAYFPEVKEAIAKTAPASAKPVTEPSPAKRYPLLRSVGWGTDGKDIVDYINLVDQACKD